MHTTLLDSGSDSPCPSEGDLALSPTLVGVSDSRSLGADSVLGAGKPQPISLNGVHESQPDEPCGVAHPSMCDWPPEPYKTGEPWNQSRGGWLSTDSGQPLLLKRSVVTEISPTPTTLPKEEYGSAPPFWEQKEGSSSPFVDSAPPLAPLPLFPASPDAANSLGRKVDQFLEALFSGAEEPPLPELKEVTKDLDALLDLR